MNEDFGLTLTPTNARRLIHIQKIFNIELPENLHTIASQDVIGEDAFDQFVCPASPTKVVITQFMLDCGLRAIVQRNYHREMTEMAVLNVIRLVKPKRVVVFTERREFWRNASLALFLPKTMHIVLPFTLSTEEIDNYRADVLIIDCDNRVDMFATKIRDFASEFSRTIIFDPSCSDGFEVTPPWTLWARALFPTMPHPLYPRVVANVPVDWVGKPLCMFAPFYNVCLFPELINDEKIKEQTTDKNLNFRVQRYKHLLNIG